MPSIHAKLVSITPKAFAELQKELKLDNYTTKKKEGFLVVEATAARLQAKYFYLRRQKIKSVDPESLETRVDERTVLASAGFSMLPSKNLAWCHEKRADFAPLEETLSQYGNVSIEFNDLNVDCIQVYQDLRDSQDRFDLKSLRIKDYRGKDGMITTANFKLMEPGAEENIIAAYGGDVVGFSGTMMTDDGRQTIAVSKKGSIRYSENLGDDVVEIALGLLVKHNEVVELETVEI